jgi:hypothetical protein
MATVDPVEAATAFHWGRRDLLDVVGVNLSTWMPRAGWWACGKLDTLFVEGVPYFCNGNGYLAGAPPIERYGDETDLGSWDLYVVPAGKPPKVGRLTRVIYVTRKDGDTDDVGYDHDFGEPFPWVLEWSGSIYIWRGPREARSGYILTERGIAERRR